MNLKDNVFDENGNGPVPFEFNETVAVCFDDMVKRSVPLYNEAIRLQCELARKYYRKDTTIYDLGCSNGNFGISFLERPDVKDFKIIAVDNSQPMTEIYQKRLNSRNHNNRIDVLCSDVNSIEIKDASVVVMNLTLQFVEKEKREELINKIYEGLVPGGIFLLTEKVFNKDILFENIQREIYYDFKKKNGYSELEINKKREALDNILVPETIEEHITRLKKTGFDMVDIYLKWFQFTSFIAKKD